MVWHWKPAIEELGQTRKSSQSRATDGRLVRHQSLWAWAPGKKNLAKNIQTVVREAFMPEDIHLFTAKRRRPIVEWCNQVPVVGSTYERYDLNVIKEHFAELWKVNRSTWHERRVASRHNRQGPSRKKRERDDVHEDELSRPRHQPRNVGERVTAVMFRNRGFLTSGPIALKSWITKGCLITQHVTHVWKVNTQSFRLSGVLEKRMQMFPDWLHYYSNLDVAPGLETL